MINKKKPAAACSSSWTDVNINFARRQLGHCCESQWHQLPDEYTADFFDNNLKIQERRQDSLNDVQHPDCKVCWANVNQGLGAHIDWWNKWNDFSHAQPAQPKVNYIEIDVETTCDLSCLYCYAECSSKIAQEEGKVVQDNTRQYDIDMFKTWLAPTINNAKDDIVITFSGGEPTASKLFYEFLDFIETLNTQHLTIDVITNANSKPHLFKKLLQSIENIKCEWNITISNESFGEHSELIRYGLDWQRFQDNVSAYIAHPQVNHINIGSTLSSLSLPTFPKFVEWTYQMFKENPRRSFEFCGGMIQNPGELDIAILPESYRSYIDETIDIVKKYQGTTRTNPREFLEYLDLMKKRIGTKYTDDYQTVIKNFLHEKQRVKKTNKLMRLINP
jgi:hypothetical protein